MLNYVLKRLLGLIPTLFIVAVLVFLFVHLFAWRSGAADCRAGG
ncbi:ABC transporter permease [Citrobacter koseri]|nr:ABC transporter permease [Citrobacter koseri]